MSKLAVLGTRTGAWAGLAVVVAGVTALLLIVGDGATIRGDEWNYTRRLANDGINGILEPPPAKYSLPIPLGLYWLAFETVGIDSYLPYRLAAIAGLAAIAFLLLELLARRIGYLAALPLAALTLVLGSADEVTTISVRFPAMVGLAFGLAALLALDHRSRRGDLVASLMLLLSVASHPLGMAFVAAAGVIFLLEENRWRRLPLAVGPGLVGLVIVVAPPAKGNSDPLLERAVSAIAFIPESLVAAVASISGTFAISLGADNRFLSPLAWLLAAALVVAICVRLYRRQLPLAQTLGALALLAVLLAAPELAPGKDRNPAADRYLHPNAVALLVVVGIVSAGISWRQGRGRILAAGALTLLAFSAAVNIIELEHSASRYATSAKHARAQLTAFDVAGNQAHPGLLLVEPPYVGIVGMRAMRLRPPSYREVAARYGSPAFSLEELRESGGAIKQTADKTLALAYELPYAAGEPTKLPAARPGAVVGPRKACAETEADADPIALGPGESLSLLAADGEPEVFLGRFAGRASYSLGLLQPGSPVSLAVPADTAAEPWLIEVAGEGVVRACRSA